MSFSIDNINIVYLIIYALGIFQYFFLYLRQTFEITIQPTHS